LREERSNKRMQLTKLRAAPVLQAEVPPCAPAGKMDGGTASQLIRSVGQTFGRLAVRWTSVLAVVLLAASAMAQESAGRFQFPYDAVSDTLYVMQEPPIGKLTGFERAFRFLWLRSFHKPILVQVEKVGGQQFLIVKMLDRAWGLGVDGVHIGKLTYNRRRALTDAEWQGLADLRPDGFWKQASNEPPPGGTDGADWILEGVSWGEHHIVTRWCPEPGPFRELCLAMVKLSGVTLAPEEIY